MWERTLQDLVRGLRANKKDEAKFISSAVDEIRREIRSDDMELKAGAVLKLTYVRRRIARRCYILMLLSFSA
jgi:AP-3 complex subunit delta